MTHVYYVVVLVIRPASDGGHQLLMGRRAEGRYMGGTWQLISGGLESGEAAWQAALREMREETGLRPRELYRLSALTQFYRPDTDSLNTAPMFCALVEADASCCLNDEHTQFEWVALDDAAQRLMWPGDRAALEETRAVILIDGMAKPYMRIGLA